MKIVEKAELPPAKCAVTGDIDGPFIDTECWLPEIDPRIYLHVPWVEQMAREHLGMVPKKDVEVLEEVVKHLADQNEDLKAELEAYKRVRKELARVS